jgi:Tol biopolymer transport system component
MSAFSELKARRVLALGGFAALTAVLAVTGLASGAQNDLTLISRATGAAGAPAQANSSGASTSADGRYVAFQSPDGFGDPADQNGSDVFVRDTQTNTTTLVSRASGVAGAGGDGSSGDPSISADGRYVAFGSDADNLDPDSNDSVRDVFVRDMQANTTTLVSRATGAAGVVGDAFSREPAISADGQRIAFHSEADNLDGASDDALNDVFLRDLGTNVTTLVSRADGAGGAAADASSDAPTISDDGTRIAFESDADNIDPDSNDAVTDVFVRDNAAKTTTLVSRASGVAGVVGDQDSTEAAISADGGHVAFSSFADNLDPDSDDVVADVFVRDLQTGATTLASRATGAAGLIGNGSSTAPSISADGRYVAFESTADGLTLDGNDSVGDVFVRDAQDATTLLVSRAAGAAGVVGDDDSFEPSISDDGGYVAFSSDADNLDLETGDLTSDVFLRQLVDDEPGVTPTPPGGGAVVPGKKCKKGFKLKKVKTKSGKRKKKCVRKKKKRRK